jgi:hypothetical protein
MCWLRTPGDRSMNDELENYAVPLSTLQTNQGYPKDTLFINYKIAQQIIDDYKKAAQILIGENNKWAKELELARNKIEHLTKGHLP